VSRKKCRKKIKKSAEKTCFPVRLRYLVLMKATTKVTTTVTYTTKLVVAKRIEWLADYATEKTVKEIGTVVDARESKTGFWNAWAWNGFGAENFRVEKTKLTREITTVETLENVE